MPLTETYGLGLAHAPQLDKTVVPCRHDQWHRGMEGNPVHTPVMTLEHEFHDGIRVTEHIGLIRIGAGDLILE